MLLEAGIGDCDYSVQPVRASKSLEAARGGGRCAQSVMCVDMY